MYWNFSAGFHRRSPSEGPTLYPYRLLTSVLGCRVGDAYVEACLGIEIRPKEKAVQLNSPLLPDLLKVILFCVENLPAGRARRSTLGAKRHTVT